MEKIIDFDNLLSDAAMEVYLYYDFVFYYSEISGYYVSPYEGDDAEKIFIGYDFSNINDFLESFC